MLALTQFWLRVFLLEWFREQFFGWLLFGWEWNRILWFRFKCRFWCDIWCLGLGCWCAAGCICSICIAGGRLEDFVPLPLIHHIACSNVDVVICGYITFIEYNIVLMSLVLWYDSIPFYFRIFSISALTLTYYNVQYQCDTSHKLCKPTQSHMHSMLNFH